MTDYQVVPIEPEHMTSIAERVRPADREEFWAACGATAEDVLRMGIASGPVRVGLADGLPFCAFGVSVTSVMDRIGCPWMVGTVDLDRHARWFLRHCRPMVEELLSGFELLENHVDARNTRAIRWLRWLGFEFDEPRPYGWLGVPFIRFERRAHV